MPPAHTNAMDQKERWPRPQYDEQDQPHFLFIIAPPYSGTTALAMLLNSSPRTLILQKQAEAAKLVPGMYERDRWQANKEIDYASVKATWLHRYQTRKQKQPLAQVVIEKTATNMVRIEQLAAQFASTSFIASNRDPYASCSSIFYRTQNPSTLDAQAREITIKRIARGWLTRSTTIRELVDRLSIPLISYEGFCGNPAMLHDILPLDPSITSSIDFNASVRVKDYEPQKIIDQNARQIAKLSTRDIEIISKRLDKEANLVDYFGYSLR